MFLHARSNRGFLTKGRFESRFFAGFERSQTSHRNLRREILACKPIGLQTDWRSSLIFATLSISHQQTPHFCTPLPKPKTSGSLFRNSAIASGLITEDQLEEAAEKVREKDASKKDVSDGDLANQLIEDEVLTRYQVEQLNEGRTKLKLGPYVITDWIGQGGMGQVFKAVHEMMGRESAVKVLPLSKATDDAKRNFAREIRLQAKLDHANLVRAYDAGEDGNVNYLVVEYVPGTDLRRLVRNEKKLTIHQAASVVMQAALGLEYAHDCELIHRDVKPGNILVTPDGIAKVSDLGLSGFINEADDPRAGKIVGTADYLAPEQIRDPNEISRLSDVYSLGCTLYYAVTGKVPFPGGTPASKAIRHLEETPWHPRQFNPDVSEEFVEVIADMMDKNPANRVQSMAEVARRLEPWAVEGPPIPSKQMSKSPWMPPPPPADSVRPAVDSGYDMSSESYGSFSGSGGLSQISQGTSPFGGPGQETTGDIQVKPPPLPLALPAITAKFPPMALAAIGIAAGVALALGLMIGFVLGFLANY